MAALLLCGAGLSAQEKVSGTENAAGGSIVTTESKAVNIYTAGEGSGSGGIVTTKGKVVKVYGKNGNLTADSVITTNGTLVKIYNAGGKLSADTLRNEDGTIIIKYGDRDAVVKVSGGKEVQETKDKVSGGKQSQDAEEKLIGGKQSKDAEEKLIGGKKLRENDDDALGGEGAKKVKKNVFKTGTVVVVDGTVITQENLDSEVGNLSTISSVKVIKDPSDPEFRKYAGDGETAVIIISSKTKKNVYVIDGKVVGEDELKSTPAGDIASIKVIKSKDDPEFKKYAGDGADAVTIITIKNN